MADDKGLVIKTIIKYDGEEYALGFDLSVELDNGNLTLELFEKFSRYLHMSIRNKLEHEFKVFKDRNEFAEDIKKARKKFEPMKAEVTDG